ncbi:uncharacterized protein DS421_6g180370 [Arachis hypogaea]|nr:uncharacterized protein DS421_6g180370 [Arachis hypogaea]
MESNSSTNNIQKTFETKLTTKLSPGCDGARKRRSQSGATLKEGRGQERSKGKRERGHHILTGVGAICCFFVYYFNV